MTKRGIIKLVVCLAVFALSFSMFFQNWFSLNRPEWMVGASEIYNTGEDIITKIIGNNKESVQKIVQNTVTNGFAENIKQVILEWVGKRVDDIIQGVEKALYFSPQMITQTSRFISDIASMGTDTINKIPVINISPAFFQKTAMLFTFWEYAIYIAAGIALTSIIIDRTIGILPYVLLLCTYPIVMFGQLQKSGLVQFVITFKLTPYAIISIAMAIILLILSIAVRDKKRYALRREAKKMKRWMYL